MDARQRLGIKHTSACDARGRCFCEVNRYVLVFFVSVNVFVGEFIGAHIAGSVSLLADSFHTLMDGITVLPTIGVALYAACSTGRGREKEFRRFVALISSVLLAGASYYILREAWERYLNPRVVDSIMIIGIAGLALIGNGVALWILGSHARETRGDPAPDRLADGGEPSHAITHAGMSYHVLSDLAQSAVVCAGGIFIQFTGFIETDIILSVLVALFILRLAVVLFIRAVRYA